MRHELTHWQPRELMLEAVQQPLDLFVARCESAYLLVVVLDALQSELAQGLATLSASQSVESDSQVLRIGVRDHDTTLAEDKDAAGRSLKPSLRRGWDAAGQRLVRPVDQIPTELRRVPCHVLPIRKRPGGASFLQHVSVGRARNHDVVLRHPSVSKFHAWFEIHEQGQLHVKDVGSQNHTFVNGQETGGRVVLSPGQTVRFGSVDCTLCTPEGLWSIMHP